MWFHPLSSLCILLLCHVIVAYSKRDVGDNCEPTQDIKKGVCMLVLDCEDALRYIRARDKHPFDRCGFEGEMEVVCCPKSAYRKPGTTGRPVTNYPLPVDRNGLNDSPIRTADRECKKIVDNSLPPLDLHIIGGEDAGVGEFPHMAALGYEAANGDGIYDFKCGGSLISTYYIMTAAHCVENIEQSKPKIARLGVVELGPKSFNPNTDINIAEIIIHPEYTSLRKYHDLTLIRLSQAPQFSASLNPACLYTRSALPDDALTVTGWGKISVDKDIRSDLLQKANVTATDRSKCNTGYANWRKLPNGISDGQFCAGDPMGRTDTCQGDSGGPVQSLTSSDGHYRIVGITSFGRGCGSTISGVYTKVSSYLDWIESVVWPGN